MVRQIKKRWALIFAAAALLAVPQAVVVSRENAGRLARLAAHGDVRVSLMLDNKIGGAFQARNVVAEQEWAPYLRNYHA